MMEKYFKGFDIVHIPRHMNDEVDKLAKAASRKEQLPSDVFFEEITEPSVKPKKEKRVTVISAEDWRTPIMEYLWGNNKLENEKEEKKIFQRARGYIISEGELFKSGVTSPWLKCISTAEGIELLKEIHSGFCGSHIGFRQLVSKAFRQGFFWPMALKDAQHIVKTCQACQMMGPKSSKPSEPTQLIPPT